MYKDELDEGLTFDELVELLSALMDEETHRDFKWEYAFESITESGSVFRRNAPQK